MNIITRCHFGARDLSCGCPDLQGAVVTHVEYVSSEEAETMIVLKATNGEMHTITIKQA